MAKIRPTSDGAGGPTDVLGRKMKQRFQAGDVLVGGMLTEFARPSLVKLYIQAGFDFLYIEYEHGYFDLPTLGDTVLCARDNGLPAIAKTPHLERGEVAKLIECGIVGIQLPRTETREQVETLRSYIKFPPAGTRAVAPGYGSSSYRRSDGRKSWMAEQDEETMLVVHIETRLAYENAEEIISTPGVDMVYVGPGDFSIEMGHPGDWDHPGVAEPMGEILAICKKHGVPFGTTAFGVDAAGRWIERGAQFFEAIDEMTLIYEGASKLVNDYRALRK